jgi:biopolymer transport protein ExbB
MLANIVLDYFIKGGPLMWPILAAFLGALCVILDRCIWWLRHRGSLKPAAQEQAREDLGSGNFSDVWQATEHTGDPYLDTLHDGMGHAHTSMLAAMQLRATQCVEQAEARLWVLSTFITLAPLLGLLGTVTGIMKSFNFVGDEQLAASKVSGGIAEALIATACGLGVAILSLLPYNYFRRCASQLRASLERWINHAELLVESAKHHGHDLDEWSKGLRQASKSNPQ